MVTLTETLKNSTLTETEIARRAVGLAGVEVGEPEVELHRDRDDPEHREVAVGAEETGELDLLGRHRLEREVDAGHDRDATARDAEVDRQVGAELERDLDQLDPVRPYREREEAAAAEQRRS